MTITTNTNFYVDICEVVSLFFPLFETEKNETTLSVTESVKGSVLELSIVMNESHFLFEAKQPLDNKAMKRFVKSGVYQALEQTTGTSKDWGSHTGVRPTKLVYDLMAMGMKEDEWKDYLKNEFHMKENKIELLREVIEGQGELTTQDKDVHFYVHIPFCPSRCNYCSFITFDNKHNDEVLRVYLENLLFEIAEAKKLIARNHLNVLSVYVGGGTPTTLNASMLNELLDHLNFFVHEFTVECGRPDTITAEKLEVLKQHGVSRICINPQTFHNKTLELIGRHHTNEQTLQAFELARPFGFDINMDLIAGLPGESLDEFLSSLHQAIELMPSSITVHTLSIKNGAALMKEVNTHIFDNQVSEMVNVAWQTLLEHGYHPYYLYRQKHQLSSQENIGYALKGHECRFNIESMEECASIVACGAGAISKRVFHKENRIERCANIKAVPIYLERLDEVLERKRILFEGDK